MQLIFLVIQIILAISIIGTVLLQKTSGDGLGSLSGGSGISGNQIISGRTSANFLTKLTSILMVAFMINSLVLGNIVVREHHKKSSVENIKQHNNIDEKEAKSETQAPVSE